MKRYTGLRSSDYFDIMKITGVPSNQFDIKGFWNFHNEGYKNTIINQCRRG